MKKASSIKHQDFSHDTGHMTPDTASAPSSVSTLLTLLLIGIFLFGAPLSAAEKPDERAPVKTQSGDSVPVEEYTVGPEDILEFNLLKPEIIQTLVTVTADGSISLPYIGNVRAKGKTLAALQQEISQKLGDGYMKYPVVTLALRESRSRKFFIYGEVNKPGSYPMEENMTVFRALAVAGGFTKFGDSSKVKILRPKTTGPGYGMVKVDIKAVMDGKSDADVLLKSGDVVVVSEGIF